VGDTDFTVERLVARANEDLANGLGNLVNRVVSMIHRYRQGAAATLHRARGGWRLPDGGVPAGLRAGRRGARRL
jgi:methionyl-tRNA synthetase